ncbi:uncharacterized protein LOC119103728 [Pollicipes pollicipes]|uniref:uncharacterized protein LOC119103728 n=1 Tax=Pollicipes pollicipes TaxID=41117 RepID=UPI00188523A1|nr:uncharacterized protein LOC119103728 [Pollicipes pollicipes]
MDTDSGLSWLSYCMFATAGLLVLGKLRFLATAVALPLSVDVDLARSFFSHESPLGSTMADEYHLRSMDAFLACVITCISTFLWRGAWGIMDKCLLPQQPAVSFAISLGLGFGITTLAYVVQFPAVKWMRSLSFVPGLFVHDALALFGFLGVINVWRGVFLFFDTVLHAGLPATLRLPVAAAVVATSVPLLMLLRLSKNLLLCGVQRDVLGPLPFNCRCLSRLLQARSLISYVAPRPTQAWRPGRMLVHIPRDTDGKTETLI